MVVKGPQGMQTHQDTSENAEGMEDKCWRLTTKQYLSVSVKLSLILKWA